MTLSLSLSVSVPRGKDEEENGPLEEGIVDDVVHHLPPVVPSSLQGSALQTRGPAEPVVVGNEQLNCSSQSYHKTFWPFGLEVLYCTNKGDKRSRESKYSSDSIYLDNTALVCLEHFLSSTTHNLVMKGGKHDSGFFCSFFLMPQPPPSVELPSSPPPAPPPPAPSSPSLMVSANVRLLLGP